MLPTIIGGWFDLLLLGLMARNRNIAGTALSVIGIVLLLIGAFLYPASSWRGIALGLLAVGLIGIAAAAVLFLRRERD